MVTKRLITALKQLPKDKKETFRYQAFLINYGICPKGEDYRQVLIGRFGGVSQFEAKMRLYHEYDAHYELYTTNTTLSHHLIANAPEVKKREIKKINTAYFEEGINIGGVDALVQIASADGRSLTTAIF